MKFLTLTFALLGLNAFAEDSFVCSYQKGEVISLRTGLRVERTFQPKVMAVARIEGTVDDSQMILNSLMDNFYSAIGSPRCLGNERAGMSCFSMRMVRPIGLNFRVYQSSKKLILVRPLSIPGGANQEDEYFCRL